MHYIHFCGYYGSVDQSEDEKISIWLELAQNYDSISLSFVFLEIVFLHFDLSWYPNQPSSRVTPPLYLLEVGFLVNAKTQHDLRKQVRFLIRFALELHLVWTVTEMKIK